jgi:hypothetical protein
MYLGISLNHLRHGILHYFNLFTYEIECLYICKTLIGLEIENFLSNRGIEQRSTTGPEHSEIHTYPKLDNLENHDKENDTLYYEINKYVSRDRTKQMKTSLLTLLFVKRNPPQTYELLSTLPGVASFSGRVTTVGS